MGPNAILLSGCVSGLYPSQFPTPRTSDSQAQAQSLGVPYPYPIEFG